MSFAASFVEPARQPGLISPGELSSASAEYRAMVCRLLESQAWRELAMAHLFGQGMKHAPELATMQLVALAMDREMEHFDEVRELYRAVTGGDVRERAEARIEGLRFPESWLELAVLEVLLDSAALFQVRDFRDSTFRPHGELCERIVASEEGQDGFGLRAILGWSHFYPATVVEIQAHFDRWMVPSLAVFGRPGGATDVNLVRAGLKARGAGDVMQAWVDHLKPVMRYVGLRFPARERIGAPLPPGLDLSI